MASKLTVDIVIIGAGLVGRTLACTLSKNASLKSHKILLLESRRNALNNVNLDLFQNDQPYHYRVSALNRNSYRLLKEIGAWKHIKQCRYGVIDRFYVWEEQSSRSISFDNDLFSQDLAYVVENDLILAALNIEIKTCDNIQLIQGQKAIKFTTTQAQQMVNITLNDQTEIQSKIVIGADGINSIVRKAFDFHMLDWNYNQSSIVSTLKLNTDQNNIAWQKFLSDGPIALLPLSSNFSSLVWSTDTRRAHELLKLPTDAFVRVLNNELSFCKDFYFDFTKNEPDVQLPQILDSDKRYSFPLMFSHSSNYIRERKVLLIGDAAHRIHPLAGQGLNLGYGDIVCLNDLLSQTVRNGSDVDDYTYLKEYETQRQRHIVPIMWSIEGLHRIYASKCPIVITVRNLGAKFIDNVLPLKKFLIKQASL